MMASADPAGACREILAAHGVTPLEYVTAEMVRRAPSQLCQLFGTAQSVGPVRLTPDGAMVQTVVLVGPPDWRGAAAKVTINLFASSEHQFLDPASVTNRLLLLRQINVMLRDEQPLCVGHAGRWMATNVSDEIVLQGAPVSVPAEVIAAMGAATPLATKDPLPAAGTFGATAWPTPPGPPPGPVALLVSTGGTASWLQPPPSFRWQDWQSRGPSPAYPSQPFCSSPSPSLSATPPLGFAASQTLQTFAPSQTLQTCGASATDRLSPGRPLAQVSELQERVFVDLVAQVVAISSAGNASLDIVVSDYSAHEAPLAQIRDYGARDHTVPLQMALKLVLWNDARKQAQYLRVGAIYVFVNVRVKTMGGLYGILHDSKPPSNVRRVGLVLSEAAALEVEAGNGAQLDRVEAVLRDKVASLIWRRRSVMGHRAAQPAAQYVAQHVGHSVGHPVTQYVAHPVAQPVAQPVARPVLQRVPEHMLPHIVQPEMSSATDSYPAQALAFMLSSSSSASSSQPVGRVSSQRQLALVSELQEHRCVDLIAQVVATSSAGGSTMDLVVSDYTLHEVPLYQFDNHDARNHTVPSPMALSLILWHSSRNQANSIKLHVGGVYLFINVRVRDAGGLHGELHDDSGPRLEERVVQLQSAADAQAMQGGGAIKIADGRALVRQRVMDLLERRVSVVGKGAPSPEPQRQVAAPQLYVRAQSLKLPSLGRPLSRVSELQERRFSDIVAQVVGVDMMPSMTLDILVSDYTEHTMSLAQMNTPMECEVPQKMALSLSLWPESRQFAEEAGMIAGDVCLFINVRIKMDGGLLGILHDSNNRENRENKDMGPRVYRVLSADDAKKVAQGQSNVEFGHDLPIVRERAMDLLKRRAGVVESASASAGCSSPSATGGSTPRATRTVTPKATSGKTPNGAGGKASQETSRSAPRETGENCLEAADASQAATRAPAPSVALLTPTRPRDGAPALVSKIMYPDVTMDESLRQVLDIADPHKHRVSGVRLAGLHPRSAAEALWIVCQNCKHDALLANVSDSGMCSECATAVFFEPAQVKLRLAMRLEDPDDSGVALRVIAPDQDALMLLPGAARALEKLDGRASVASVVAAVDGELAPLFAIARSKRAILKDVCIKAYFTSEAAGGKKVHRIFGTQWSIV